jgi:hypothetical protein
VLERGGHSNRGVLEHGRGNKREQESIGIREEEESVAEEYWNTGGHGNRRVWEDGAHRTRRRQGCGNKEEEFNQKNKNICTHIHSTFTFTTVHIFYTAVLYSSQDLYRVQCTFILPSQLPLYTYSTLQYCTVHKICTGYNVLYIHPAITVTPIYSTIQYCILQEQMYNVLVQ